MISLTELGALELENALASKSGRSGNTIYGGHERHLRQTIIALKAGCGLADHESPGEATLQVLRGNVSLTNAETGTSENLSQGDFALIPPAVHGVEAHEDSVLLLTVSLHPHS